jgi:hypothetical protein
MSKLFGDKEETDSGSPLPEHPKVMTVDEFKSLKPNQTELVADLSHQLEELRGQFEKAQAEVMHWKTEQIRARGAVDALKELLVELHKRN